MQKWWSLLLRAIKGTEKNFTTGSINRAIFFLAIPMIMEMLMESAFALVDIFFVAQISTDAVAAVGLTETVVTLVYSIAIGLAMAATAMVARRVGEGKHREASWVAGQAIWLGIGISVLVSIFGTIYAPNILRLMGASETLIANNVGYTRIIFASNTVIVLLFLINGVFRGAGDASLAMRALWLANGLNILLDPLFIFGIGPFEGMGVTGAAVATTIGRAAGVSFQLYVLFRGSSILRLKTMVLRVSRSIILRLLNIASTGASQFLIGSASWIFLMRIIARFGDDTVAGYTISIRLIIFTILPAWGLANAAATLVGQNLGAGKPERAEISVWRTAFYNMLFLLSVSVVFFLNAEFLIGMFTKDPLVISAGVQSLKIFCIGYTFFSYGMVISQSFNGAGDTRTPTVINLICFWLVEIPLAYFLAIYSNWGPSGVYWSIAISESLLAVIAVYLFRLGRWKLVKA
ncbi:MAG: MATE family efflux transporter [Saprospiraceae bacterium]|nr:MATE family efflux transporter [Saprospiraceae bacterium]